MKKIYILYFMFCVFNSALGQQNTFLRIYNNFTPPNHGSSVIQTYDGNYLITLITSQPGGSAIIFKADSLGIIDSSNIHLYCGLGARSLADSGDSNYVFISSTLLLCLSPNNFDLLVYKVNKNGDTLWSKVVTNTTPDEERGAVITKLHDGNFIIGGASSNGVMNLWKIDSLGNLIWSKSLIQNVQYVNTVIEDSDSNLIVAGSCNGGDGWAIVKMNSTADSVLWVKKNTTNSGNGTEEVNSILELDNGNYFIGGDYCQLFNCGHAILERNTGNILWSNGFQGARSVDFTSDGNIIIAMDSANLSMLKVIDQAGNYIWSKLYPGPAGYDYTFYYVRTTADGGFAATGVYGPIMPSTQLFPILLKTDSLGHFSSTTEINELIKSEDYNFYPNPLSTQSKLTFKNPNKEKFLFTLYDITGRVTESVSTTNNEIILTKCSKQAGVYLFNLMNEKTGERWNGKIIVSE